MAKVAAKREEEEMVRREHEAEARRLIEKKDREDFQKELNDTWNAKFESVCGAICGGKNVGSHDEELAKLKKQVELLQIKQLQKGNAAGASSSRSVPGDDTLLARLMQEQEIMKKKMESAFNTCKRMEGLEKELRVLKQSHEKAVLEAETWKKEALKSGNKRSQIATSPSSQLKMPLVTPRHSPGRMDNIQHVHNLEVEALQKLRLQEMNWRREAEQENARLKEQLAKQEAERRSTPRSTFRERLDDAEAVGGTVKSTKVKKKSGSVDEVTQENDREVFIREAKKELRDKKKDEVTELCVKEGVEYSTLSESISDIIAKWVERAFGKKPAVQEISEDVATGMEKEDTHVGRDSTDS
ncbi:hypothetical protein CBR_g8283 [Chara braunii]|uniref:Uncharacterized protein n=1 Tax=Chara braunii TaxID=69332 RepID=A0A388KM04_CHABU|nr:hypothetical protein CBR_g8283 [Chara braunii]|eukprot:GBG70983.1 hypothetical protein CBR_g8283 [Chara braunii]